MDSVSYQRAFDKEQLAILCANYDRRIDSLGAENAKLRELVRYAYECAVHSSHETCDECKEWNGGCILADRMCELGVDA